MFAGKLVAAAALAAGLAVPSLAQAHSNVSVGFSFGVPVYGPPVVVAPAPVYVPRPVYGPPVWGGPVYVRPAPVYAPPPVYRPWPGPGYYGHPRGYYGHGWHGKHWRGHGYRY